MTTWSSSGVRTDANVACPECGRLFSRRGLPAHRRMRHGPGSPPETVVVTDLSAPAPALPRIDDNAAIARALEAVAIAVTRLEARLDQVLAAARTASASAPPAARPAIAAEIEPPAPLPSRSSGIDKHALERELSEVMAEISRARVQDVPASTDQPADHHGAHALLGKLRRRQASILARLLQLDGDPGGDEMTLL